MRIAKKQSKHQTISRSSGWLRMLNHNHLEKDESISYSNAYLQELNQFIAPMGAYPHIKN